MSDEEKGPVPAAETVPAKPPTPEKPHAPLLKEKTSGLGVASLVLGIAGLTICPLIGALLALIFGIVAKGEIRRGDGAVTGSGMATAGIVLGVIGLVIPMIFVAVAVPLGIIFLKPEIKAASKIIDGASAARIYYFEHNDSYKGMRDTDLGNIDESVDFRMAPGRTANAVYIDAVTDRTVRLYCYSSRGHRYIATARGDNWRYNIWFWSRRLRWLDNGGRTRLFDSSQLAPPFIARNKSEGGGCRP